MIGVLHAFLILFFRNFASSVVPLFLPPAFFLLSFFSVSHASTYGMNCVFHSNVRQLRIIKIEIFDYYGYSISCSFVFGHLKFDIFKNNAYTLLNISVVSYVCNFLSILNNASSFSVFYNMLNQRVFADGGRKSCDCGRMIKSP